MRAVFAHVYGVPEAPDPGRRGLNIEVSLVVQPDDTRYLARPGLSTWAVRVVPGRGRVAARPLFARKMRPVARAETPARDGGTPEAAPRRLGGHGAPPERGRRGGGLAPRGARLRGRARAHLHPPEEGAAQDAPEPFRFEERRGVLELVPGASAERCRLKVLRPREGKERLCAFFYKESNLGWSRDHRYSYGAVRFFGRRSARAT